MPGSPALNAGTGSDPDQRGVGPVGRRDIGAFESRGFALSLVSGGGRSAAAGTAFGQPLVVAVTATDAAEPVDGGVVSFVGDTDSRDGVRLVAKDLDGDSKADLLTAAPGDPDVSGFAGRTVPAGGTPPEAFRVDAPPADALQGVFVG